LDFAQDTAKKQLRAYVGVEKIWPSQIFGKLSEPYEIHVELKNYGQTPATVAFIANAQLGGEQPRPASVPRPGGAPQILQPGRTIRKTFSVKEIKGGDDRRLFVILRVFYTDIYGNGYGHRLDYVSPQKPGDYNLECTHESESVHTPTLNEEEI